MKGFEKRTIEARLVKTEYIGTGAIVSVCVLPGGTPAIEIQSAAEAVQKSVDHLIDYVNQNDVTVYDCSMGSREYRAISSEDFINFVMDEAKNDNPYAMRIMFASATQGVRNYFNSDGTINVSVAAAMTGVTEEELHETIESDDFQSFLRNQWH